MTLWSMARRDQGPRPRSRRRALPARRASAESQAGPRAGGRFTDCGVWAHTRGASEKDAKLAQKLGQLQPFMVVFPQECMGQFASFGPCDLTPFSLPEARRLVLTSVQAGAGP
jgi:hypothetical protein